MVPAASAEFIATVATLLLEPLEKHFLDLFVPVFQTFLTKISIETLIEQHNMKLGGAILVCPK